MQAATPGSQHNDIPTICAAIGSSAVVSVSTEVSAALSMRASQALSCASVNTVSYWRVAGAGAAASCSNSPACTAAVAACAGAAASGRAPAVGLPVSSRNQLL